jgi:hypothetical protein
MTIRHGGSYLVENGVERELTEDEAEQHRAGSPTNTPPPAKTEEPAEADAAAKEQA